MGLPIALETVLSTLAEKCQLTSWAVHGKGKMTTLILRWQSEDMAAMDNQPAQPVSFLTRYRRKSPSELRRDSQRAILRKTARENPSEPTACNTPGEVEGNNTEGENTEGATTCGLFDSPPPSHVAPPVSGSTQQQQTNETEREDCDTGTESDTEQDRSECSVANEEETNIQEFWNDQWKKVEHYLSDHICAVEKKAIKATAALPVVKKVVCDHRYGKHSLYALTEGIVFEYDLDKHVLKDWLPVGRTDRTSRTTYDCIDRWSPVDQLRFSTEIDKMTMHIHALCQVIHRIVTDEDHDPDISDPKEQ